MKPKTVIKSKILLLGDSGVGKTCIFNRFFFNKIFLQNNSTQGVISKKKDFDHYEDASVTLEVWDTAGQERYRSLTRLHYQNTNGIVFIFDLTNLESFKRITLWVREVKNMVHGYIKLLVGNKSDLVDSRKVSEDEINAFVDETKFFYLEASANKNINISEIFTYFANETYRQFKNQPIPIKNQEEEEKKLKKFKLEEKYGLSQKYDKSCSC